VRASVLAEIGCEWRQLVAFPGASETRQKVRQCRGL